MPAPTGDPAATVRALLAAARLPAGEEEIAGIAASYPALRSQADGLYLTFLEEVSPAIGFTAAFAGDDR